MAKQIYKSGLNVAGLSVKDILKIDYEELNKLNRQDLSRLTSRLASAGNKRLRRLEKAHLEISPAYESVKRSGGDFSVKGKNIDELRHEFTRVQRFLNPELKTSTVKGTRKYVEGFGKYIDGLSDDEITDFFKILHKLQEEDPAFFKEQMKYNDVSEYLSEKIRMEDPTFVLNTLRQKLTNVYEAEERVIHDTSSQFNNIFDDTSPVRN